MLFPIFARGNGVEADRIDMTDMTPRKYFITSKAPLLSKRLVIVLAKTI